MGKRIDALFCRRTFKSSKFKATLNLAISRLSILKNQRQSRSSISRSDVVEFLNHGHYDRALIRVGLVIGEQNMLDVFVMIEGYCHLVKERINLIENEKVCPEELEEAVSSLIYAATRCGEIPELQEIRAVLTTRFGKDFAARAAELRNNSGVNLKMVQKLSTKHTSLVNRMKVLQEIASKNGISLLNEEESQITAEPNLVNLDLEKNSGTARLNNNSPMSSDDIEKVAGLSDSMKGRIQYRDAADAAQAAFESAAYAAAAARAAVELSRSESFDPDDQNSPSYQSRKVFNTHKP